MVILLCIDNLRGEALRSANLFDSSQMNEPPDYSSYRVYVSKHSNMLA